MPISEDEYDTRSVQESRITMSKAELRKTHKPIMEKRRRARINHCLNEIKSLVLEAMNKDPSRHSKLEKADILEMAVKHLQNIQRQQLAIAMATNPSAVRKFRAGFDDCADEIDKCLNQIEGVGDSLKQGLTSHLRKCMNGIEQVAHLNFPDQSHIPFLGNPNIMSTPTSKLDIGLDSTTRGDPNNNPYFRIPQGLQLVPERLRPGELTLLLSNVTNNFNFSNSTSGHVVVKETERPSAFATVIPSALSGKLLSPPLSPKTYQPPDERSSSPKGFRPVHISIKPVIPYSSPDDAQVCQISSTSAPTPSEIKTIRFPIQNSNEKRVLQAQGKIVEPLCVITNQGERYKQAKVVEDSVYCEENIQRGTKRTFGETQQGLLVVTEDYPHKKKAFEPSSSFTRESGSSSSSVRQPAKNQNEDSSSEMWRPW
ncbi:transcription factor HES-1-like [Coccinella septempunctata]|uniref:transcription factor HES-1-like n=1 Tax=Coccinella septempunctata TaxID=41139 RepID=UPI001D07AE43|nr:transcription factor HES-1-like [Coccinella septempunctata]